MKNFFLNIFFIFTSTILLGQIHEIGFFLGGSNYVGDIGKTNFILPNKLAGGIIYKYNYNPRVAFRTTYTYLPIKADDKNASNPYRIEAGKNFTNTIHELTLGLEFNFFEYNVARPKQKYTPYILLELAAFSYQTPQSIASNNTVNLKSKISYAVPFGLGIKGRISYNLACAIEAKARYTFVDDLDYSTTKFPENPILNFGGQGNDWYMFTGVSLVYTFGRPPCYSSRF